MDEVIKMYAMNDGNPDMEPAELSADHDELEEDDEVETLDVLTSSDDDDVVVEEGVIIVDAVPVPEPGPRRRPPGKLPPRKLLSRSRRKSPRPRKQRKRQLRK